MLIASPFKGIFPGIATQLVATRGVVHNLYNNLYWEENRKTVYETVNFSMTIVSILNDLDHALVLANDTLNDVRKLKEKYIKEFSKYQYSFSEYSEIVKKINKIENSVLNNKIKMEIMKEKMKQNEKQNDKKIEKVKKLNCS